MNERTLLLVDDEENILAALARVLRQDGYRILRATSGEQGLELLAANRVGVIVSDQRMPGMKGSEFLDRVKTLYPDTMRIVLSGYTELASITDAINRGAIYKFLTKPWDDDLLRENVHEAFLLHEMKQENQRLTKDLQSANETLSSLNQELEHRVEQKTGEVIRNTSILRISQEILNYLPLAVVGIDVDGMIAATNRMAEKIFARAGAGALLGEMATERLPSEMQCGANAEACCHEAERVQGRLPDGAPCYYWCYAMTAPDAAARGWVLVVDPVDWKEE